MRGRHARPAAAGRSPRRVPTVASRGELILSVAYHEAGHAAAGVALGFSLHSVEVDGRGGGRAFFASPPKADRNPWYAVVGAAGPTAQARWLWSEGLPLATMDGGDVKDWRRVKRIAAAARAAGASSCHTGVLRRIAGVVVEDARVWAAVGALAAELFARLAQDGDCGFVLGDEATAIMGAHGVAAAMRLPPLGPVPPAWRGRRVRAGGHRSPQAKMLKEKIGGKLTLNQSGILR